MLLITKVKKTLLNPALYIAVVIVFCSAIFTGIKVKADAPYYELIICNQDGSYADVKTGSLTGNGWSFDPSSYTLTLNGYSYNGTGVYATEGKEGERAINHQPDRKSAIYYFGDKDLTINLVGDNSITVTNNNEVANQSCIFIWTVDQSKFYFTGTGTLNVKLEGQASGDNNCIGTTASDLIINSGTIKTEGGDKGIFAGSVTVKGGTINTSGGNYGLYGGSINIDDGTVNASGKIAGIAAGNTSVTIKGGTVTATGESFGVSSYNSIYLSGGTCEFTGGSCFREGYLENSIEGTGWNTVEGTGDGEKISVSSGTPMYKKAKFPVVEPPAAPDGSKEGTPAAEGTALTDSEGNKTGYTVTNSNPDSLAVIYEGTADDKNKKDITIPDTVKDASGNEYKVTEIKTGAFKNLSNVKTINVGKYVTKIGSKAFYGCKKLNKLTINGNVLKTIGKDAFKKTPKGMTVVIKAKNRTIANKILKKIKKAGAAKSIKLKYKKFK